MICRDPCVGAAGQTAPTNGLQLPLEMLFDVVYFTFALAEALKPIIIVYDIWDELVIPFPRSCLPNRLEPKGASTLGREQQPRPG